MKLCTVVNHDGSIVQVQQLGKFSEVLDGKEFEFVVHRGGESDRDPRNLHVSHHGSGRRLETGPGFRSEMLTPSAVEIAAMRWLKDFSAMLGEDSVRATLESMPLLPAELTTYGGEFEEAKTLADAKALVARALEPFVPVSAIEWTRIEGTIWEQSVVDLGERGEHDLKQRFLNVGVCDEGIVSIDGSPFADTELTYNTTLPQVMRAVHLALYLDDVFPNKIEKSLLDRTVQLLPACRDVPKGMEPPVLLRGDIVDSLFFESEANGGRWGSVCFCLENTRTSAFSEIGLDAEIKNVIAGASRVVGNSKTFSNPVPLQDTNGNAVGYAAFFSGAPPVPVVIERLDAGKIQITLELSSIPEQEDVPETMLLARAMLAAAERIPPLVPPSAALDVYEDDLEHARPAA